MRLPSRSRRSALALLGIGALAGGLAYGRARHFGIAEETTPSVSARPIPHFHPDRPEERRFGALLFRSGVELLSRSGGFGGWSGLWRDPDAPRIVAVGDHGQWLTAGLAYADGRLSGLREPRLAPILGESGSPLHGEGADDCEALAMADGVAFVGIERAHGVRRFAFGADGVRARGVPVPVPGDLRRQPRNAGIEALCVAPPGHPLAGALIAFAEASPEGGGEPMPAWVLTGPDRFAFRVAKAPRFNVTDAAMLPGGELLLLERSFSFRHGSGCRIRRFAPDAIVAGATLEGEVIFQADRAFEIDNMECLAIHRDAASGATVLTLMSDDNFMPFQRTLLLEFAFEG